jgi:NADH:ubiquinone oxidoreductase subunit 6 (subunit J)
MQIVFLIIAGLGLLAALGTVLARNLVHAALFLIAFFFTVACLFVLLEAEFLAALQVLVYIGAVAIILMFGIMLTRNVQGDDPTSAPSAWYVPGAIVGLGLFAVLGFGISFQGGGPDGTRWAQMDERPSINLQLMSWGDGVAVPTSGNSLVIVGLDNNGRLHIRIFDARGIRVTDTDETNLPDSQAVAVSTLKQRLPSLLPPHELTGAEKSQLIVDATSIVGRTSRTEAINHMAKVVGDDLLTRYVIAFEVAGLLLTAALVGAIALAHREEHEPGARRPAGKAAETAGDGSPAAEQAESLAAASPR